MQQPGQRTGAHILVLISRYTLQSLIVVSIGLLSGCGGTSPGEQKLAQLQRQIRDIRDFQGEQLEQLNSLEERLREVSGRLERFEHGRSGADLEKQLKSVLRRVPPPAIVPAVALDADEVFASKLSGVEGDTFRGALEQVRLGDFPAAHSSLEGLIDGELGSDLLVRAAFWRGVIQEGLGDNRRALVEYNKLLGKYSDHSRARLSLLRLASVFIRMGDSKSAKVTLDKIVSEYPNSEEAKLAKEKRKDLK